ncbi:MAG: CSS-motif domain-containing protein, partial [Terracidiphilus sp.]
MQRTTGVSIAMAVGSAAIVAPILLSIHLAWIQGLDNEENQVRYSARDVLRRSEETRDQIAVGIQELRRANLPACSPGEIDLMRRVDLNSSYIQAVARIQGNNLACTSLGTTSPIPIGPPMLTTENGAVERLNLSLPIAGGEPLDVVSLNGYAFLVNPSLPVDTKTEGPGISLSLFVPSSLSHAQLARSGSNLRPEWFRSVSKGGEATFVSGGYVVCLVRSADADLAAVAAAPITYVTRRVAWFAALFVPIGLACGLVLAWAVVYLTRRSLSASSAMRAAA